LSEIPCRVNELARLIWQQIIVNQLITVKSNKKDVGRYFFEKCGPQLTL